MHVCATYSTYIHTYMIHTVWYTYMKLHIHTHVHAYNILTVPSVVVHVVSKYA
jgi:hypothetical protein